VNPGAVVDTEPGSPMVATPENLHRDATERFGAVESWLHDHLNTVAVAVMAAGFVVRIWGAARDYLNPDEAMHYVLLNQPSAFLAYRASLTNAHPPLIYLLVYYCHLLGRSELMLRLPSVVAGTALCWFLFKWIGLVFGKAASLIGLVMAAFLPPLVSLSSQLREYAILVFFIAGALYFLERALQEKSVREMAYFSAFLYLAILSHYSAAFFVLAMGLYTLARIADSRLPRNVVAAWAGGQVGALVIYAFLYVTHVSKIRNNIAIWAMPFDQSYFHVDRKDVLTFTQEQTAKIFDFLFEQPYIAQAMFLLFVVAVVFLILRDLRWRRGNTRPGHSGILLLLPFVAVWGAAIAGKYPYVGSRHTVFLAPFAIAALSFLLASIFGQKLWAGLLIAVFLVGASNASGKTAVEPHMTRENRTQTLMTAAMNHIFQTIPRSDVILVDYQTIFPMDYYFCGPRQMFPVEIFTGDFFKIRCNGYTVVSPTVWKLTSGNFQTQFEKMTRTYGLKPGERVWVFQSGWGTNLDGLLPRFIPKKFTCLDSKSFGDNLVVIPFVVGPDFLPVATLPHCSN
jgi:hypothetical protein